MWERFSCAAGAGRQAAVRAFLLFVACLLVASNFPLARAAPEPSLEELIQSGVAARSKGDIQLSVDLLSKAWESTDSDQLRARISAELGASLLQARRLDDAEKFLQQAYAGSTGLGRARVAEDLGNLAFSRSNSEFARRNFDEAQAVAGTDLRARCRPA